MLAHIHSGRDAIPLEFVIRLPIIDTLIGHMFFHPDDQGGTTKTTALKLFKCVDNGDESYYIVVIPYPAQFSLVVAYVSGGCLFGNVLIFSQIQKEFWVQFVTLQRISNLHRTPTTWKP